MTLPPAPASLERAASWSWRVLVVRRSPARRARAAVVRARHRAPGHARADDRTGTDSRRRVAAKATRAACCCARAPRRIRCGGGADRDRDDLGPRAVRRARRLGLPRGGRHHRAPRSASRSTCPWTGPRISSRRSADSGARPPATPSRAFRRASPLLTGLVLAVAVLYFVLRDGAAFWLWVLRRFSPETRPVIDRAGRRAWAVLGGFVRGTALIASIDALLIGIGLWLLGVPLAFALAVLVFLGAFVPFVGAFVVRPRGRAGRARGRRLGDRARGAGDRAGRAVRRGQLPPADHPEPHRRPAPCS